MNHGKRMGTQNLAPFCLCHFLESEVNWWCLPLPHKFPRREGRPLSSLRTHFLTSLLYREGGEVFSSPPFVVLIPYALWVFLFHAKVFFIADNSLCLWPQLTLLGRSLSLSSRSSQMYLPRLIPVSLQYLKMQRGDPARAGLKVLLALL